MIFPEVREKADSQEQRRRTVEGAARRVLAAFRRDRDRLTYEQWAALEDLEEALYGGEE
mgnify:CR=1 FL=1